MAALAGGDQALADAAASLEQRGYIRPGSPEPAREPVPPELAGWSANPAGQPAGVRRVAISGDLGIITRMRSQPYWVAEVSTAADPRRPDFVTGQWALAGGCTPRTARWARWPSGCRARTAASRPSPWSGIGPCCPR